ncbi:hypothetical protein CDL12_00760 [Handroanthus impetiginosus]|uniref:Uncharacterized protein n=1 Tax=Handroanthus impetiginosus TaxID=429701 RepID=A0A2G9IA03_9LAMI|nr:hypothetical protein CDL12_00760 [Handroanthus impetiginosus]
MGEFEEEFKEFQKEFQSTLEKQQPEEEKEQPEEEKQPEEKENANIYKIPTDIHKDSDGRYAPFKVSFGPYYHDHESCKSTEDIKKRVVMLSLATSNKTISNYEQALRGVVEDLRKKYKDLDRKWKEDDEAFLRLMIFDGCFLLEDNTVWKIAKVSHDKLMEDYRHDMLLLENQLPMLVLEKLYDVQNDISVTNSTPENRLAVQANKARRFIREKIQKLDPQKNLNRDILKFVFPRVNVKPTKNCLHVLDLYRHSLLTEELGGESRFQQFSQQITDSSAFLYTCGVSILILLFLLAPLIWVILALVDIILFPLNLAIYIFKTQRAIEYHFNIPSATDINDVGIGLMSEMKSLSDISWGRRILRLPHISIDGATESIFLNIIAFEKLHKHVENEVTSYIYFMSSLIKRPEDIRHLQRCGVIDSGLRTHEEIFALFNSLTKDINVHNPESFIVPRYRDASEMLTNGFRRMNKPWRKDLWQTYLKSPWAFVSILAAFLLFALTAVQTAYTVFGYYNSK